MSNILHLLPVAFDAANPQEGEIRASPTEAPAPSPAPARPPRAAAPAAKQSRVAMVFYAILLAFVLSQAVLEATNPSAPTAQGSSCPTPKL